MPANRNGRKADGKVPVKTGKARSRREEISLPRATLNVHGSEIQTYGAVRYMPIALNEEAREESCALLNQILADSIILYNLYKKHHWQITGPTFYQLHLLFDKHASEQLELIDLLAERVQMLGGVSIADPRHVAEITKIERAPNGAEDVPSMISRLLDAHEIVLSGVREGIDKTEKNEDWGSNDLLMSDVLRTNEMQVWFVSSHLVDTPLLSS
jgi:starvation-inducible DNA-binding protein